MIPNLRRWVPPSRAFNPKAVVRREFYALAVILVTPWGLDIVVDLHETGTFHLDPV